MGFYFKLSLWKINFRHDFHGDEVFSKILYESVLLSIIKVPYKSALLSVINCRHLSLTYHTQKFFIKAFYCLAKMWLCVTNVTYHSQNSIINVLYYIKFPLDMWNKQHSVYIKSRRLLYCEKIVAAAYLLGNNIYSSKL